MNMRTTSSAAGIASRSVSQYPTSRLHSMRSHTATNGTVVFASWYTLRHSSGLRYGASIAFQSIGVSAAVLTVMISLEDCVRKGPLT
jgi:hypothetical protein